MDKATKDRIEWLKNKIDAMNTKLDDLSLGDPQAQAIAKKVQQLIARYEQLITLDLPDDFPTVGNEPD